MKKQLIHRLLIESLKKDYKFDEDDDKSYDYNDFLPKGGKAHKIDLML